MQIEKFKNVVVLERKIRKFWPLLIIIGVFLPWLRIEYTIPTITETLPPSEEFSGWDLANTDIYAHPVANNISNFFSLTPYLFLIFGGILFVLLLSKEISKKEIYTLSAGIVFSFLSTVIAIIDFFELTSLEGGDARFEIGCGIYVILLGGLILVIDLLHVWRKSNEIKESIEDY